MNVWFRCLLLALAALLPLISVGPADAQATGGASRGTTGPLTTGWGDRQPLDLSDGVLAWEDVAFHLTDRLAAHTHADVFPRHDVVFNLTNQLFVRRQGEGGHLQLRELGQLRVRQGLDLGGQAGEAFGGLASAVSLPPLRVEARASPASVLHLRTTAAYNYAKGWFELADAGLTLQPFPRWASTLQLHFRDTTQPDFLTAGLRLTLSSAWSLAYALDYNARTDAVAQYAMTGLYRFPAGNLSVQIARSPVETRVGFEVNVVTFLRRQVGF